MRSAKLITSQLETGSTSWPPRAWYSAAAVSISLPPFEVMKSTCTSTLFLPAQVSTCWRSTSFVRGTQWSQNPSVSLPAAPTVRICASGSAAAAAPVRMADRRVIRRLFDMTLNSLVGQSSALAVCLWCFAGEPALKSLRATSPKALGGKPATRVRGQSTACEMSKATAQAMSGLKSDGELRGPGWAAGPSGSFRPCVRPRKSRTCLPPRRRRRRAGTARRWSCGRGGRRRRIPPPPGPRPRSSPRRAA